MFSESTPRCFYKKSLKWVFLSLHFHFLRQVNCQSKELTTKTPPRLSVSFGKRLLSTSRRSSDRHALVRGNRFVLVFVETVFLFIQLYEFCFCWFLLKCHFVFAAHRYSHALSEKSLLLFPAVTIFSLIFSWELSFISQVAKVAKFFIFLINAKLGFYYFLTPASNSTFVHSPISLSFISRALNL